MKPKSGIIHGLSAEERARFGDDAVRIEYSDSDGTERETAGWRGFFCFAGAAFFGYAVFVILLCLLTALLLDGCSSAPDGIPVAAQVIPAAEQFEQHWCCKPGDDANARELFCGSLERPEARYCYCAGVVHGAECEDVTRYTPGSLCTAAGLVCW